MFRSDRVLILLGVVLAVAAFGIFYFYSSKTVGEQDKAAAAVVEVQVVVATKDVPAQTVLKPDMLKVQSVDQRSVTPDNLADPGQAIGKSAISPLMAGQRVLASQIGEPKFSLSVPQGKRAFAMAVDELSGVGGLIRDGDYVDVLASVKIPEGGGKQPIPQGGQAPTELPVTKAIIEDIQVLKVIQTTPPASGQDQQQQTGQQQMPTNMVVLAVTDQQAELIKHTRENGILHLALRAQDDHGVEETTGVTRNLLQEKYGVPTP